uniref:Uncharacterized protein n=1 Tax=Timema poppense TaxID=170557 RepID=A0A7R9H325_TIMPO|nr:unnamed protein product [Timema poppensis]
MLSKKKLSPTITSEPALRETQCPLNLVVRPSSPPPHVCMCTTVKHNVAGTVKHTVPYKDVSVFNRQPSTLISSTTSSSYSTSTVMTTSTANPTTIRPTSSYKDFDLHNYNIKSSTKKTSEYDKHPNEVVKNEELTYNRAIKISAANYIVLLILTTVFGFLAGTMGSSPKQGVIPTLILTITTTSPNWDMEKM